MTSGMTAFMVAVGGTSLVCYLLMIRVQNRKTRRESAGGDASGMGSGDSSGGGSWSLFGSDSSSSHNSGSSSDSGSDGGGGGGDGGGGGGDLTPKIPGISARQRDLAQRRLFRFIPVFPLHQYGIS